jgi:hypothetical protein
MDAASILSSQSRNSGVCYAYEQGAVLDRTFVSLRLLNKVNFPECSLTHGCFQTVEFLISQPQRTMSSQVVAAQRLVQVKSPAVRVFSPDQVGEIASRKEIRMSCLRALQCICSTACHCMTSRGSPFTAGIHRLVFSYS